jgi:hypothetical protein
VFGYALVMPRDFAVDVPILRPMFDVLDSLSWRGVSLRGHSRWFVVGQVCVALAYRGRAPETPGRAGSMRASASRRSMSIRM